MQYLCSRFRQLRSLITQKSAVFVQANAILEENYCRSNIPLKNIREARGFEDRGGMAQPKCARRISLLQANSDEGAIVYRLGQEIFIL